jgi:conjugative transposon TraN protein
MKHLCAVAAVGFIFCFIRVNAQTQAPIHEFRLQEIGSQSIPVTVSKITSIIFPVKIQPAGKGTKDILAQKVKGTDNVLMVKAARPGFTPTNLTVIGMNGRVYSLILRYEADPDALIFRVVNDSIVPYDPVETDHAVLLSGKPVDEATLSADGDSVRKSKFFLHKGTGSERMRLVLRSIYIKNGLLWFTLQSKNRSLLDYQVRFVHLSIQDTKRAKRTAIQEKALQQEYAGPEKIVPGNGAQLLVYAFNPFSVPKHKKLVIQMSDPGGGRVLTLPVGYKTVLKARTLD